jgi:copper chaperone CopZ
MRTLLLALLLFPRSSLATDTITRVTANLNGVTSPRGFFNITVRLSRLRGVEWAKYDLKKSMITLDFQPGVTVTPAEIGEAMSSAGYKPGAVHLEQVPQPDTYEHRLGWNKIKRPTVKNPVGRWFQVNF